MEGQTDSGLAPHAGVPASTILGRPSLLQYLSKSGARHDAGASDHGGYRSEHLIQINREVREYARRNDTARRLEVAKQRADGMAKLRHDAITSGFGTNDLRFLEAEVLKTEFSPLYSREILGPCVYSVPEGFRNYTWRKSTSTGEAEAIANDTDDVNNVDMYLEEFNQRFQAYGIAYGYSAMDQAAEAAAQMPITIEKGQDCVDRLDRRFDSVARVGDSRFKLSGFFSHADIPVLGTTTGYTTPAVASNWKTLIRGTDAQKTAFITAFGDFLAALVNGSGQVEKGPFVVAGDFELWMLLNTTPRSSVDGMVLMNVLRQNPYLRDFVMWPELSTAGVGEASRVVAFSRDPRKIKMLEAVRFKSIAPREKGFSGWSVGNFNVLGGVIVPRPAAHLYFDIT